MRLLYTFRAKSIKLPQVKQKGFKMYGISYSSYNDLSDRQEDIKVSPINRQDLISGVAFAKTFVLIP